MALEVKRQHSASSSSWSFCNMKCLQIIPSGLSSSSKEQQQQQRDGKVISDSDTKQRKPGGWKAMPFILGLSLSLSHTHGGRGMYKGGGHDFEFFFKYIYNYFNIFKF